MSAELPPRVKMETHPARTRASWTVGKSATLGKRNSHDHHAMSGTGQLMRSYYPQHRSMSSNHIRWGSEDSLCRNMRQLQPLDYEEPISVLQSGMREHSVSPSASSNKIHLIEFSLRLHQSSVPNSPNRSSNSTPTKEQLSPKSTNKVEIDIYGDSRPPVLLK